MKKLLSIFAISVFTGISAQTEFGVKAGYNLSGMKIQDLQLQDKSYFYVGGLAEHRINEKFSLQGELLYTELGGKYSEDVYKLVFDQVIQMGTAHIQFRITQLQLPLSAKYYFIPNFSLSTGLTFGFNIAKKFETDFVIEGGATSGNTDLFKTVNIFPFLGTDYQLTKNLFIDARYNFGVFDVSTSDAPKTKVNFLQAGLGYRFK